MSDGPRIVFTRFLSITAPKLHPWREHYHRVVGGQPTVIAASDESTASSSESVLVWHLVSANNRMLARSANIFFAFDDAVESANAVSAAAPDLDTTMVADRSQGVYGWYGGHLGQPLFTCARWYDTERERRKSIDLALDSLAIAAIATGARTMHPALMKGPRESVGF